MAFESKPLFHPEVIRQQVRAFNRIRLGEHVWRGVLERETMTAWHRTNLIQLIVTV